MLTSKFNAEYRQKLIAVRNECAKKLEGQGLYVETSDDGDTGISLSISLTQFGLDGIYAAVTQEELEYIIDNGVEL